jgi:hypothetical protein
MYQALLSEADSYLRKVGIPASLIDRLNATDSTTSSYLTPDEHGRLVMAPHWAELKIAKCGPEPELGPPLPSDVNLPPAKEPYSRLAPNQRRHLAARAEREICWRLAQSELRQPLIDEFHKTYGQ